MKYGQRDLGTGTLINLDSGGRGGRTWSDESKKKLSNTNKGRISPTKGMALGKYSPHRIKLAKEGRTKWLETPESRIISNSQQGKIISTEQRKKISESMKTYKWINNGIESKRIKDTELSKWLINDWKLGRLVPLG